MWDHIINCGDKTERHQMDKIPLVKIKKVRMGITIGYRVYKYVNGGYKSKGTFRTMHQAQWYVLGMGEDGTRYINSNGRNP